MWNKLVPYQKTHPPVLQYAIIPHNNLNAAYFIFVFKIQNPPACSSSVTAAKKQKNRHRHPLFWSDTPDDAITLLFFPNLINVILQLQHM